MQPPVASSAGIAWRHIWNVPFRLTSTTRSQSASVIVSVGPSTQTPAQLTRTSSRPNRSTAARDGRGAGVERANVGRDGEGADPSRRARGRRSSPAASMSARASTNPSRASRSGRRRADPARAAGHERDPRARRASVPRLRRSLELLDRVAAVDDDPLARDVARRVGREEGDHLGDLVGRAGSAERRVLAADRLLRQLRAGRDPAGLDGVDGDALPADLDRQRRARDPSPRPSPRRTPPSPGCSRSARSPTRRTRSGRGRSRSAPAARRG